MDKRSSSPPESILRFNMIEKRLKNDTTELNWKSKALEEAQNELIVLRSKFTAVENALREQERKTMEVQTKLSVSQKILQILEKDKTELSNKNIKMEISCRTLNVEKTSLIDQICQAQMKNTELQENLQHYKSRLWEQERRALNLANNLKELEETVSKLTVCYPDHVKKLEKEQALLCKSVKSTIELNKRLQAVGLATHAIFQKQKDEIAILRKRLDTQFRHQLLGSPHSFRDVTVVKNKRDTQALLRDLDKETEKDKEMEEDIEKLLREYGKNF